MWTKALDRNGSAAAAVSLLLLAAAAAPAALAASAEQAAQDEAAAETADDLTVVDCLLPPRLKRLGTRSTYLAPRQPVRATAARCRLRGGEYTEPDLASYETALQVWQPQAEAGSSEAQYFVGQIYEKGLGTAPDYARAAIWYERAASQGYTSAQVSLAYLYETGLGVDRDELVALNWYRRAAGLAQDLVVLDEADYEGLLAAQRELRTRSTEADALGAEVAELRRQLEAAERRAEVSASSQETLRALLARLEAQLDGERQAVARSEAKVTELEAALAGSDRPQLAATVGSGRERKLDFGRYYALVVGNSRYRSLPDVANAADDARAVAELLESRYGFEVELLLDATRFEIMSSLNDLRERLTRQDNLLVYYAGHGVRDEDRNTAYWQPVDASPDLPTNWIPSGVLADHLDLVQAKHVLVVADSVFSGLRSRSSIARLPVGMDEEERFYHIKQLLDRRARLVLSSESTDAAPAGPVRFSQAFVESLSENGGVLEASRLYQKVNARLTDPAGSTPARSPVFATMRWARGDVSEFFFVPR